MYNKSARFLSICTFGLVLTLILSIADDCRLAIEQAEAYSPFIRLLLAFQRFRSSALSQLNRMKQVFLHFPSLSIVIIEQAESCSPFILLFLAFQRFRSLALSQLNRPKQGCLAFSFSQHCHN